MDLGLSFGTVRGFHQIPYFPIGKMHANYQCPSLLLCPITFVFPRNSFGCLLAQLQDQVCKSQDHCPKPGQAASILWLNGSRETGWGNTACPAQRDEQALLSISRSTHVFLEDTHK